MLQDHALPRMRSQSGFVGAQEGREGEGGNSDHRREVGGTGISKRQELPNGRLAGVSGSPLTLTPTGRLRLPEEGPQPRNGAGGDPFFLCRA